MSRPYSFHRILLVRLGLRRTRRAGLTLVELLVVISIIGVLIALLLPAIQAARETARRAQCRNHLKQMALGVLEFESGHGTLPSMGWGFNWIGDPDRGAGLNQPGGWFYAILPYIEQQSLANIGKGLDGGDPTRTSPKAKELLRLMTSPVEIYYCPSRRPAQLYPNFNPPYNCPLIKQAAKIDYAGNGGDNNIIDSTQARQPRWFREGDDSAYWEGFPISNGVCIARCLLPLASIEDGASNTYMMGEKYLAPEMYEDGGADLGDNHSAFTGLNWDNVRTSSKALEGDPYDYQPPRQDIEGDLNIWNFGSAHAVAMNMAHCDGSVHDVAYDIDPEVHRLNSNRADGQSRATREP